VETAEPPDIYAEPVSAPLDELPDAELLPKRKASQLLRKVATIAALVGVAVALVIGFIILRPSGTATPSTGPRSKLQITPLRTAADLREALVAAIGKPEVARQVRTLSSTSLGGAPEIAAAVKGNLSAQMLLGQLLLVLDAPQAALEQARAAASTDSTSQDARVLLGEATFASGDPRAAIALYKEVLSASPTNGRAHLRLGEAHQILGELDLAMTAYHQALSVDPKLAAPAHTKMGEVHTLKQQSAKAYAEYRAAATADDRYAPAHVALGYANSQGGFHEDALKELDRAIQLDPESAIAFHYRAATLFNLRRADEAISSFQRALALRPAFVEARYHLGQLYLAQGKTDLAKEQFETALKHNPDYSPATIALLKLREGK
jgi:tetratricopeptide (TPR) repeat protein